MDTTTLEERCNDITALCKSNLTSAQLAQKTKEYETAAKDSRATTLLSQKTKLTAASSTISNRLDVVKSNTNITPELIKQYTTLNDKVTSALNTIKTADPLDDTAALPVVASADDLLVELDVLDNQVDEIAAKTANVGRRMWNIVRRGMPYITVFLFIAGAILGGVIASNIYATESFWAIKLYYFVYGAALFPVSLAIGAYNPPTWAAGFIPLNTTSPPPVAAPITPVAPPTSKSVAAAAGAAAATAGIAAAAGLAKKILPKMSLPTSLPKISLPKISLPKMSLPAALPKISLPAALPKISLPAALPKISLPTMTLPAGLPKISLPKSLPPITFPKFFGGGSDTGVPPPEPREKPGLFTYVNGQEFMNKNVLRGLAITEIICLGSVAVFYGVDKMVFKL
jgi:hypothetical protein